MDHWDGNTARFISKGLKILREKDSNAEMKIRCKLGRTGELEDEDVLMLARLAEEDQRKDEI